MAHYEKRIMKKYVLGIAGHIASGKTTVGKYLQKLGAEYIDADQVVDQLYGRGQDGYRKIFSFFGEEYFKKDGELNRHKLAKVVFGDPKKLRILHDLIHPLVTSSIQKLVDKSAAKVIVIEATYFEKKHLRKLISGLLWLECPKELLFKRLSKTSKPDRKLFERIYRIQVKPDQIDFVLTNAGTKPALQKEVKKVWKSIAG